MKYKKNTFFELASGMFSSYSQITVISKQNEASNKNIKILELYSIRFQQTINETGLFKIHATTKERLLEITRRKNYNFDSLVKITVCH